MLECDGTEKSEVFGLLVSRPKKKFWWPIVHFTVYVDRFSFNYTGFSLFFPLDSIYFTIIFVSELFNYFDIQRWKKKIQRVSPQKSKWPIFRSIYLCSFLGSCLYLQPHYCGYKIWCVDFWNSKRLISRYGTTRFTVHPNRLPVILHKTSVWLCLCSRRCSQRRTKHESMEHLPPIRYDKMKKKNINCGLATALRLSFCSLFFVCAWKRCMERKIIIIMHLSVSR